MDSKIRLGGIKYKNKIAGPWPTTTIYTQGCYKNCKGCFNQSLRELEGGREMDLDWLVEDFIKNTPNKKVTFCGGEPMIWAEELAYIADKLHEYDDDFTVLCYTGYEWEDLIEPGEWFRKRLPHSEQLVKAVDILVVGQFEEDKKLDIDDYKFVGSTNQRVIDVKETLKQEEIIIFNEEEVS